MSEHLLSKHKVLIAFNIAKSIKKTQIKNIKNKFLNQGVDKSNLDDKVDKHLIEDTKKYLKKHIVPGLINNTTDDKKSVYDIDDKIKNQIIFLANELVKDCNELDFNKDHIIILTQIVMHLLQITNEDVNNFKQKYNINNEEDDDYLDDEDDE